MARDVLIGGIVVAAVIVAIEPITPWTRVATLDRSATLVVQDSGVHFVDVATTAPPREVYRRFPDGRATNSAVAIDHAQRYAYVNDGERIVQIDRVGNATVIAALHDMRSEEPIAEDAMMNWHFSVAESGRFYFSVLGGVNGAWFFGEYDPADNTLRRVDVGALYSVAVDGAKRRAYAYHARVRAVAIGDFVSGETQRVPVEHVYALVDLSPDRTRLVLSTIELAEQQVIATFDLQRRREVVHPVRGSNATWLDDDTLLFQRGEGELWQYDIGGESTRLFHVPRKRDRGGSYAHGPKISTSGRLLEWGFATGNDDDVQLKTIVVDLDRGEYRLLDGWWHNVNWLE